MKARKDDYYGMISVKWIGTSQWRVRYETKFGMWIGTTNDSVFYEEWRDTGDRLTWRLIRRAVSIARKGWYEKF